MPLIHKVNVPNDVFWLHAIINSTVVVECFSDRFFESKLFKAVCFIMVGSDTIAAASLLERFEQPGTTQACNIRAGGTGRAGPAAARPIISARLINIHI